MREVGVLEARTAFSALIEEVETRGEPVTITRHGRPVAKIVSASASVGEPRRIFGAEGRAERLKRLGEDLLAAHPELASMSWEEMKALARE